MYIFTGPIIYAKRKHKNIKKLTEEEKALYPKFLLHVNTTVEGEKKENLNYRRNTKPMEEATILSAMRKAEEFIQIEKGNVFSITILEKTNKECRLTGEPFYTPTMTTRVNLIVHMTYDELDVINWHFTDDDHHEYMHDLHVWTPAHSERINNRGIIDYGTLEEWL